MPQNCTTKRKIGKHIARDDSSAPEFRISCKTNQTIRLYGNSLILFFFACDTAIEVIDM